MKSQAMTAAQKFSGVPEIQIQEGKIARALEIISTIEPLKEELEGIKQYFKEELASDRTETKLATASGTVILKLANSYSVMPESIPALKGIFKKQYDVFVSEKISFGCTAAMKKLLDNNDYDNIDTIRESVIIKQSPSVSFEPATKLAKGKK